MRGRGVGVNKATGQRGRTRLAANGVAERVPGVPPVRGRDMTKHIGHRRNCSRPLSVYHQHDFDAACPLP